MLWLYRLLFLPVLLAASPFYLRRMRRRGGYGRNFRNRFGSYDPLPPKRPGVRRIWLQAVSVGEVLAIAPLLEALGKDPTVEIFLTTTTSTGYALAREKYAGLVLGVGYFPLDFWMFSVRAWRRIGPDLAILTEGERWRVRPARVQALLKQKLITPEQADGFIRDGALGSHLENLQRKGGFKGFNQKSVSVIIAATDPRKMQAAHAM